MGEKAEREKEIDEALQQQKNRNINTIEAIRKLKGEFGAFNFFTNQENGYEFHLVQTNPPDRGYFIWKKRIELLYTLGALQYKCKIVPLETRATDEEVKMYFNAPTYFNPPAESHKTNKL